MLNLPFILTPVVISSPKMRKACLQEKLLLVLGCCFLVGSYEGRSVEMLARSEALYVFFLNSKCTARCEQEDTYT